MGRNGSPPAVHSRPAQNAAAATSLRPRPQPGPGPGKLLRAWAIFGPAQRREILAVGSNPTVLRPIRRNKTRRPPSPSWNPASFLPSPVSFSSLSREQRPSAREQWEGASPAQRHRGTSRRQARSPCGEHTAVEWPRHSAQRARAALLEPELQGYTVVERRPRRRWPLRPEARWVISPLAGFLD